MPCKCRLQLFRTPALAGPGWLLPSRRRRGCRVAPALSLPVRAIATTVVPLHRMQGWASALAVVVGRCGTRSAPRYTYHARLYLGALQPCRNGG